MLVRHLVLCFLFFCCCLLSNATGIDFKKRLGSSLNKVTLFPDSSFQKHSNIYYEAGSLFEITSQSNQAHEDADQKQTFRWYEVITPDEKRGWIFGDGLAVIVPDKLVDSRLTEFHKKSKSFSKGFENSVCWVAAVEGRDIVHKNAYMNPRYIEEYLVISNEKGKSVHINTSGASMHGESNINSIQMIDITDDGIAEIILEKKASSAGSNLEHNNLEIYSFQAGNIVKVFEDHLSLNYNEVLPSPALNKFIEIDHQTIRLAYIDYVRCEKYSLRKDIDEKRSMKERCLEYVTYSYLWETNQYKPLYEKSRIVPKAKVEVSGVRLLKEPGAHSASHLVLKKAEIVEVIKHYEEFVKTGGIKKVENYFLVRNTDGYQGYVPAQKLRLMNVEHADLLSDYYKNPPISKRDWKSQKSFLSIKPKTKNQSVSR